MTDPFVPPGLPAPSSPAAQPPPPGAYRVPVGGYQAPIGAYSAPPAPAPSRATGAVSLAAALVAALVTPVVAGVLALQIGLAVSVDDLIDRNGEFRIAALSPARIETLWAEIMFWLGTALGLFGVIGGIVAVARRRGRGMGIAAIVVAALGPGIFFLAVALMYGIGNGIAFDPLV
ncbi:hypothetical protein H9633_10665 [Microbacterium sp. Re1]|uniref:Uncharacterized protein n=1 Tax=Microbacterium commune TaxID=2762219 RepID=A0ABR8W6X4_9MICO|nr:hypothetical protein [Microbacterium commune]MBD8012758.1 hypothetical protein [Microbacterium commune]